MIDELVKVRKKCGQLSLQRTKVTRPIFYTFGMVSGIGQVVLCADLVLPQGMTGSGDTIWSCPVP